MTNKPPIRPIVLLALFVGAVVVFRQYEPTSLRTIAVPSNPKVTLDPTPLKDLCAKGVNLTQIPDLNVTADAFARFAERFRNGNSLKGLINGTKTSDTYVKGLIYYAIPGIVFAILTFLVFLVFLINCVCRTSICLKKEYTQKQQRRCLFPTFFFSICLLAATGVVFVFTVSTYNGILQSTCVVQNSYNQLNFGSNYNQTNTSGNIWIGLIPLSGAFQSLSSMILNLPSIIGTQFDNTTWVDDRLNNQTTQLDNIYSLYQGQTLSNPDPKNSTNVTAKIVAVLGPPNTPYTYLGNISLEVNYTMRAFKLGIDEVRESTDIVRDQAKNISSAISNASSKLNQSNNALTSYKQDIQSFSQALYNTAPVVKNIIFLVFAVLAAILLVSLIITFITVYLKFGKCRIFLHVFWILGFIFCLLCFGLTIITLPSSIVASESCDIIQELIYTPNSSTQYVNGINPTLLAELNTCLFEDGNFTKFYNISRQIGQLNNMSSSVLEIFALQDYVTNLTMTQKLLDDISATLNFTMQADLPQIVNNSATMLNYLNSWADFQAPNSYQVSVGSCKVSLDTLENTVFYCPTGETRFQAGDVYNYQFGQPVCIEFDLLDPTQAALRYNAASYSTCNTVAVAQETGYASIDVLLRTYYTSLNKYQASVTNLFTKMYTNVTNYKASSDAFVANITQMFNVISNFNSSISQVTNTIVGQKGLTNSMNCSFLGAQSRQLYQSVCNQIGSNYIVLAVVMPAFGFFLLIVSILAYCVAARTSRLRDEHHDQYMHPGHHGQYHQLHHVY